MIKFLRRRKWKKIIIGSGLFDLKFYLFTYPDIRLNNIDPIMHYIVFGSHEGRNPSNDFDTSFYITKYPDVQDSDINPLVHYILFGYKEGRFKNTKELNIDTIEKNSLFDKDYYLSMYPDVNEAVIDPVEHYVKFGALENRNPSNDFDTSFYVTKYPDVQDSGINPLVHYILFGDNEFRDTSFYIKNKSDLNSERSDIKTPIPFDQDKFKICPTISFPNFSSIEVSIIIPAYNQAHFTYNTLNSLIKNISGITYEVILMDDNSNEEYAKKLHKKVKNLRFIRNNNNLGFLKNCNKAISLVKGKFVVFLNNDVQVRPNWLNSLIETLKNDITVGLVGSKLIYPNGMLQEAGGIIWKDATGKNYGRGNAPNKSEYNYVRETDYISGASIAISRKLLVDIGGFDERYTPAYYEDTDLAFSVRKKGYKVVYQPKSELIHFEGISHGTDISSGVKKFQVINQSRFFNKWKKELSKQAIPNQQIFLAKDRSFTKKHILIIDQNIPQYDKDAGSRFLFHYLLFFKDLGFSVTYVPDDSKEVTKYSDKLQQQGIYILYKYDDSKLINHLKVFGKHYDYAYINRPNIARNYFYNVKKYTNAKIFYFCHDLHFLRIEREPDSQLSDYEKKLKKDSELNVIKLFDVIHTPSAFEEKYLKQVFPNKIVRTIPLFLFDYYKPVKKSVIVEKNDILFVGGFLHKPNVDGILWFIRDIFPIIRRKIPKININIVGSNPTPQIEELRALDGVNILGYVTDTELSDLYRKSKLSILPLRFGAGLKGKLIEAIYNNIPIVATSIAAEGLPENILKKLDLADDKKAFANIVISKYNEYSNKSQFELSDLLKKYYSISNSKSIFSKDMEFDL